ncbi:hypothetical protein WJX73_002254 [Symbiochloris irregularis]|uniref:Uncharacterized protein n=1 Tax=Symbiochloris irregularis TaxID=706552 RepID=A0AAW1NXS4_9CHLO
MSDELQAPPVANTEAPNDRQAENNQRGVNATTEVRNAEANRQHKEASLLHNHAEKRAPRIGSQFQANLPAPQRPS